nr:unnamed protein product [Timema shepardi]CAD7577987.1 unnamed protein product [Timema californicum]
MLRFGPSRAQVFAFLGIQRPRQELSCAEIIPVEQVFEHQPIYMYKKDPYLDGGVSTNLPDVVTQGVLSGLYGSLK